MDANPFVFILHLRPVTYITVNILLTALRSLTLRVALAAGFDQGLSEFLTRRRNPNRPRARVKAAKVPPVSAVNRRPPSMGATSSGLVRVPSQQLRHILTLTPVTALSSARNVKLFSCKMSISWRHCEP